MRIWSLRPQYLDARGLVALWREALRVVHEEALNRDYRFAVEKITRARSRVPLRVTRGQLEFEWRHLLEKLEVRDPERLARLRTVKKPRPHPMFRVVRGSIEQWERGSIRA